MDKQKENPFFNKDIQEATARLISEEYIAAAIYIQATMAAESESVDVIADLFNQTAKDELDDHMAELVKWCRDYGYDVPCSEKEFRKEADKDLVKLLDSMKKKQNAGYYLDLAAKSEELAIASYKKVLELKDICQFTDLQATLWHIYYDEEQHLRDINSTKAAFNAGVDMIIG